MKINLTIFTLFISGLLYAQRPNMGGFSGKNASLHNGQISGKLVDAKSGDELAFANVRLFRKNDILMEGTIVGTTLIPMLELDTIPMEEVTTKPTPCLVCLDAELLAICNFCQWNQQINKY